MNLLIISRASYRFPDGASGADNLAWAWATQLAKANQVAFVSNGIVDGSASKAEFISLNLDFEVPSHRPIFYFAKACLLSALATTKGIMVAWKRKYAVVQTHAGLSAIMCKIALRHRTVVHTVHDPLFRGPADPNRNSLIRALNNRVLEVVALKVCDVAVVVSPEIRHQVIEAGIEPSRIKLISFDATADISGATKLPAKPEQDTRKSLNGANTGPREVLLVGALYGRKRVDLAIRALQHVQNDARLTIVGEGPKREEYQRIAETLGLSSKVQFVGRVSSSQLAELYRTSDLYLLVSDREGAPVTLREAAMYGLPALRVDSGTETVLHQADAVMDTPGQMMVRSSNPAVIAQHIDRALQQVDLSGSGWDHQTLPYGEASWGDVTRLFEGLGSVPASQPGIH